MGPLQPEHLTHTPLHTTTLPHLLPNLDHQFPCACACAAVSETEVRQPDYMEELGWRQGIEMLSKDEEEARRGISAAPKPKVSFSENVEVKEIYVDSELKPCRKAAFAGLLSGSESRSGVRVREVMLS